MSLLSSFFSSSLDKTGFEPSLSLSYSINGQWFFRYNGYVSGYAPSLSDFNDISQAMDKYQIRKGNPGLKPVTSVTAKPTTPTHIPI